MTMVVLPAPKGEELYALEPLLMQAVLEFSAPTESKHSGGSIAINRPTELSLEGEASSFSIDIPEDGDYALFTEHHLEEFHAKFFDANGAALTPRFERAFKPDHEHDEEVSSVGVDVVGDLDKRKFNQWLSFLLQTQGTDIFRMKGVISLAGEANRFVFQGVHMLFDGRPDRAWGNSPRRNQLIFIGRKLDRAALNEGFTQCLV
jgi:G3E family GTPase